MENSFNCITVLGPTATGKTSLAVKLALWYDKNAQIISADSRQVYKGLDLGSGKDLNEFSHKNEDGTFTKVPYHLIDITDLSCEFSVFNYQQAFYRTFAQIIQQNAMPIICGGTGMYLDSILRDYKLLTVPTNVPLRESLNGKSDAELVSILKNLKGDLHNSTDLTERHRLVRAIEIAKYEKTEDAKAVLAKMPPRPNIRSFNIGLTFPRSTLRSRIKLRLIERLKDGMIEEVENLVASGVSFNRLERLGLEYRFIAEFLQGKFSSKDEFIEKLYIAIGQFAKRQETWFRGMEKKGIKINWLNTNENTTSEEVFEMAKQMLENIKFD